MNAWGWAYVAVLTVVFITFVIRELRWINRMNGELERLIEVTERLMAEQAAVLDERRGEPPA